MNMIEVIGYLGSTLVVLSLMMRKVWWLRWINLAGAAFFCVYGSLLHATPIIITNGFIVCIDLYYIRELILKKNYFHLFRLPRDQLLFIERFVTFHKKDIAKFFPHYAYNPEKSRKHIIIRRNMLAIGVFIYEVKGNEVGEVKLDYVIPEYRDLKSARALFREGKKILQNDEISLLTTCCITKSHKRYLKKVGFTPVPGKPDYFSLKIEKKDDNHG